MPPSPALRCSPARELRTENNHKRGLSFESGLSFKSRDDDLVLFNEMQTRERDTFLLHSNEDFDDSLSKLKYFSNYKLDINIPVRGESSDMLNADSEKNDYDWLLTPPDTPLFPSLDDDDPLPANLSTRGRPRSQPVSIPRSSMVEKSQRSGRSSPSPHRVSPSPRSSGGAIQPRGRPSSAPQSSPISVERPGTPSRRPSTPPSKPSTPTPRSSTPTFRRMSTGSSGQPSSSGKRGISPIKGNRGNSASPKLRAWQSSLPGFSSDAPPNLRTSLSDRPVSYTRGSSPASRNGRELPSKLTRRSASPTASRSGNSSLGHDRDRFSPHSKGSIASSGDDDVDSLHSISTGIPVSAKSITRKNGVFTSDRATGFPKKPSRTPSVSSVPKRYFDSAIRQMDHRKTPQNMFRPLLSSAPTSSFYVGKASSTHRPMFSRNSSFTTSSNASSELGAGAALDSYSCDLDHTDLAGEWEKVPDIGVQEEVFAFDKKDEIEEDGMHDICSAKLFDEHKVYNGNTMKDVKFDERESSNALTSDSCARQNTLEIDNCGTMVICSVCGKKFHTTEFIQGRVDVCHECAIKDELFGSGLASDMVHSSLKEHVDRQMMSLATDGYCNELQIPQSERKVPEMIAETSATYCLNEGSSSLDLACQTESNVLPSSYGSHQCQVQSVMAEKQHHDLHSCAQQPLISDNPQESSVQLVTGERDCLNDQVETQKITNATTLENGSQSQQSQSFISRSHLKVDSTEAAGISVLLLNRSCSSKGPLVQGRVFSASNLHCDGPLYARESMSSMKLSVSRSNSSVSSSLDLNSSRQMEAIVQRQLSSRKGDLNNLGNDVIVKSQNSMLSPEILNIAHVDKNEEHGDGFIGTRQHDFAREPDEHKPFEDIEGTAVHLPSIGTSEYIDSNKTDGLEPMDDSCNLENTTQGIGLADSYATLSQTDQDCVYHEDAEIKKCNEVIVDEGSSEFVSTNQNEGCSACLWLDSSNALLESESNCANSECSKSGWKDCPSSSNMESSHAHSISMISEKDISVLSVEINNDSLVDDMLEESTVTFGGSTGQKSRSITLEEATDTVLLCSSIIHDLAYKAATIGLEKEELIASKISRPTITVPEKSFLDRKDQSRTHAKRAQKPQRAKKMSEADVAVPLAEPKKNTQVQKSPTVDSHFPHNVENTRPPKLESKCNCTVM